MSTHTHSQSDPTADSTAIDDKTMKCIRCGFCLDACPTFRLTGQETKSPRGRIYLVRSWRENIIPFDENVVNALDTCLGCRACETACPSGVEYGAILEMARAHIEAEHLRPSMQSFAREKMLNTLTNPAQLAFSLKGAGLMGKLTKGKMPGFAAKMLSGSSEVAANLPTAQGEAKVHNLPERSPATGTKRHTVGILAGCVMRVLFGGTNAATVRVLQANGCEVVAPRAAGCCGALHLHTGFHQGGMERAQSLIDAFAPYLDELDAIVINSAGCGSTMKEYGDLFADDPAYCDKAHAFAAKVVDVSEWLMKIGLTPFAGRLDATVSYHDACHLAHGQKVRHSTASIDTADTGREVCGNGRIGYVLRQRGRLQHHATPDGPPTPRPQNRQPARNGRNYHCNGQPRLPGLDTAGGAGNRAERPHLPPCRTAGRGVQRVNRATREIDLNHGGHGEHGEEYRRASAFEDQVLQSGND